MPAPITPVNDRFDDPYSKSEKKADWIQLLPLFVSPNNILQDYMVNDKDRESLKDVWLKSMSKHDGSLAVESSVSDQELRILKSRGLIEGVGREVKLTQKGSKVLSESILDGEQSSFVRQASKKLIARNSYDFGDEVLVRINNKDKFGVRYVAVSKEAFSKRKASPIEITDYDINTKNQDGSDKSLSDYSDLELIKILHLARRIVSNKSEICKQALLNKTYKFASFPANRIKAFASLVLEELNSR